ncbi:MAG: porin [Acidobacteriaceae bacterium]
MAFGSKLSRARRSQAVEWHALTHRRIVIALATLLTACFLITCTAPAQTSSTASLWTLGGVAFSGYLDTYYSYNQNRPSSSANGQTNDLYNFDDKTDQFNLAAADLTLNHDPAPVGVHIDLIAGRANTLIHSSFSDDKYIEQAYLSAKPPKTHGTEFDLGQFVSSAGAEVIPTMNIWDYSHSLLFTYAVPYFHFGLRTSTPITKNWAAGLQLVNGWNNVVANNGGITVGLTNAYTRPRYTWDLNIYTGPSNNDTQKGYRNLIDTTLLLTPTAKFNAYVNYDYGQNHTPPTFAAAAASPHWQGIALAARQQITTKSALAARYEYFDDNQGFQTGTAQRLNEVTTTYEYNWLSGLLMRAEFRRDSSNVAFFHKGSTEFVNAQSTATLGLIAFFGPKG